MLATLDKKSVKDLQTIYAKATAFYKKGQLAEAARSYRYFLSKWPEPTAFFNYAVVLKQMQQPAEALQNYQNAIALKPDYVQAYINIANIHTEQGEFEKSLEPYTQAIRLGPSFAPAYYNRGLALQNLQKYQAALADFEKSLALDPDFTPAIVSIADIYRDQGESETALEHYGKAILKNPTQMQAYCNRGTALQKLQRYDAALADFEKALALAPDYAQAFVNIGNVHTETAEFEKALDAYGNALRLNPALTEAYYNRGVALQEMRRHHEALADFNTTLELNPQHITAYLNKAVILSELKRKTEALSCYEQLFHFYPGHARASWNLSLLKLSEGDFESGFKLYESRMHGFADDPNNPLQKPNWRGAENLAGKTLFIRWEQGFGDTIQFSRYAKLACDAGARVILAVQNPLQRLIRTLDDRITVLSENEVPEDYDYFSYLLSLPNAFAASLETIPCRGRYLDTDPASREFWKARLDPVPEVKIGLVWAGAYRPDVTSVRRNDANRSLTLEQLAPLVGVSGTAFFSLQKGPKSAELATSRTPIQDWTDALNDFADTGALVENLDLVITVDTAVAHLAAALGKPVWLLIPFVSCWRWFENRTDSPWYDTVKLFRQAERGNWDPVIEAVRHELQALASKRSLF